jgi:hypothetical protein
MQKKTAILSPLGLATMLAAGFLVVIFFVASWVAMLTGSFDNPGREYRNESILLRRDGTAIVYCQYNGPLGYRVFHHALDGKEIKLAKTDAVKSLSLLQQKDQKVTQDSFYLLPRNRIIEVGHNNYARRSPDEETSYTSWFFVRDGKLNGKAYFVGYDLRSKQCLGYIGRRGKTADMPPEEDWFPFDGRNYQARSDNMAMITSFYNPVSDSQAFGQTPYQAILLSGEEILKVDFKEGTVATWRKLPQLISCATLYMLIPIEGPPIDALDRKFAFRTSEKVYVFDEQGKETASFSIPEKLRDESFSFAQIDNERAFIEHQRVDQTGVARQDLYWIDVVGKITRQEEFTFAQSIPVDQDQSTKTLELTMFSFMPPCINGYCGMVSTPRDLVDKGKEPDYAHALRQSLKDNYVTLITSMAFSLPFVLVCYRRQRRYALPWTWVWVGFVFLTGLPGFLGYRFHRRWAVLDDCPQCKIKVPRDREACPACNQPFPLPEQKGIEVFA